MITSNHNHKFNQRPVSYTTCYKNRPWTQSWSYWHILNIDHVSAGFITPIALPRPFIATGPTPRMAWVSFNGDGGCGASRRTTSFTYGWMFQRLLVLFFLYILFYEFLWNSMISTMIFYVCLLIPPWLDPIDFIDTWDVPKVGQRAEAGRQDVHQRSSCHPRQGFKVSSVAGQRAAAARVSDSSLIECFFPMEKRFW